MAIFSLAVCLRQLYALDDLHPPWGRRKGSSVHCLVRPSGGVTSRRAHPLWKP